MRKVYYVNFDEDINKKIINENREFNTLYLFPTRANCNKAKQLFLSNWNLNKSMFFTFEDFKSEYFISKNPILKEEKRILTIFKIMTKEDKYFFHLRDYFNSIKFIQQLLQFWQELQEEFIKDERVFEILEQTQTAGNWQEEVYSRLIDLKNNYYQYLEEKGFSDTIFTYNFSYADSTICQDIDRVVVVNQFYHTKLEKKILEKLKLPVHLYYQLPQDMLDEENLEPVRAISATDISSYLNMKIPVAQFKDEFSMLAFLFSNIEEFATVLDFRFLQKSYSAFFDPQKFSGTHYNSFAQSRFYQFLQNLHNLHRKEDEKLFSIQNLLDACLDDLFLDYFGMEDKKKLRAELFYLIDNDLKSIDSSYFHKTTPLKQLLVKIQNTTDKLDKINSVGSLQIFFSNHIEWEVFQNIPEFVRTDLPQVYFQALADFSTLEEFVENWYEIFPKNIAQNLCQLFLDYLKPQRIKASSKNKPKINITNLQGTRNMKFGNMHILNVSEGVLPAARQPQFLFSENQRSKLGLKNYEDIKHRDKYYFYRLLCQSKNPQVYTIKNEMENIEISSFLEELRLQKLTEPFQKYAASKEIYKQFFQNFSFPQKINNISQHPEDFFTIPFHMQDIEKEKFSVSPSSWQQFHDSPFEFYFKNILRLQERKAEVEEDFSKTLLGTISHNLLNSVWEKYIESFKTNKLSGNLYKYAGNYIQYCLNIYLQSSYFKYRSPQNYSEQYFKNIFLEFIKEGIKSLILKIYNNYLPEKGWVQIFPEKGKAAEKFITTEQDINIFLRGKADLRFQNSEGEIYIIDYKTGVPNGKKVKRYMQQLAFYEAIYYLLEEPEKKKLVNSALYFIEEKDLKF
ncbi:MAG: PD-(D/E)XK nuclease family protein, partial [Candidatus Cloacimonadota bacterium]|nr:PD-(D/E)XK nuclease family protein [Candidatus Cloacimonadota bacterium]